MVMRRRCRRGGASADTVSVSEGDDSDDEKPALRSPFGFGSRGWKRSDATSRIATGKNFGKSATGACTTMTTVWPRTLRAAIRNELSCSIRSSGVGSDDRPLPGGGAVASK
jgi:hypothetical protein